VSGTVLPNVVTDASGTAMQIPDLLFNASTHLTNELQRRQTIHYPIRGPRSKLLVLEGWIGATSLVPLELKLVPLEIAGDKTGMRLL
jgi:hypothetical protein